MPEALSQQIQKSPFKNAYWFSRYLINTDQFGALGKNKEKQILKITLLLENELSNTGISDTDKLILLKYTLISELQKISADGTKSYNSILNLTETLDNEIKTIDDVIIFCTAMKYIVAPINHAISTIPSDDKEYCCNAIKNLLDSLGEQKVGLAISTWDNLGVKGCLEAERAAVIEEFQKLLINLSYLKINHTDLDDNLLLTAFIQEFERRLGQKRKSRGGNSLETVTDFLFKHYGFNSTAAPSHFDQDLEVDKWFKCRDGWTIGISCKRTLRERWKQVSQADRGTLSHFKIKELWHLITYDNDLSDDKIVRLGEQGQIFYLMDDSKVLSRCINHPGMKDYVRPLSRLISDIRKNIK